MVVHSKGRLIFGPSRFLGYVGNTLEAHERNDGKDGRDTNDAISAVLGTEPASDDFLEAHYKAFCARIGVTPNRTGSFGVQRKYWFIGGSLSGIEPSAEFAETEREQLVLARVGQGRFRQNLIDMWGGCSITGCKVFEVLRASHIKAWKDCSDEERLDPYNGLLLLPNLDVLFDNGYVSFLDDGRLIVSPSLSPADAKTLGVHGNMRLKVSPRHRKYLAHHRENVFRDW